MPLESKRKIPISVSLESEQVEQLEQICKHTRIPRSVLIREGVQRIIEKYLSHKTGKNPDQNKE